MMDESVINIADLRIARRRRDLLKDCPHRHLVLLDHGEIVKCKDCDQQLTPYWALKTMFKAWNLSQQKLTEQFKELQDAKQAQLHTIAAKKVAEAWRSRTMVPSCPHCHRGILSSDGFGNNRVSKRGELALRSAQKDVQEDKYE